MNSVPNTLPSGNVVQEYTYLCPTCNHFHDLQTCTYHNQVGGDHVNNIQDNMNINILWGPKDELVEQDFEKDLESMSSSHNHSIIVGYLI